MIACYAIVFASLSVEPYAAPPVPGWLREITRVAYTDLPNRNAIEDWPDQVIADFAAAGVQLVFSRAHSGEHWDGLGWLSRYGAPDPRMEGRCGTRHVVELCHRAGLRYIAYYWAQREPRSVGEEHPEWRCLDAGGRPTGYYCVNQPGYRELVRQRIVELVGEVGCDGIFFDMFHPSPDRCYCDACRAAFRAQTGEEPPAKQDFDSLLWQEWTLFKQRTIEGALLDFNRAIKAANSDAALVTNTWNAWVYNKPGFLPNSIRVAECVDGLLEEIGWYDYADPGFFAFPARWNFMCWHLGGLARHGRAFMWSAGGVPGSLRLGAVEPDIRAMTMLTNGCVPSISVPGRDVLARYLPQIATRDEVVRGATPYPWCGLVVSEKTELWYGRDRIVDRYIKGVYGAWQALAERHLPVRLVTDRDLELGRVPDCRVLLLPNAAAMSEAEAETLRAFVRAGGGLVATYETSLYDEHGRRRDAFALADLFRGRPVGRFDNSIAYAGAAPEQRTANIWFPAEHRWSADPELRETMTLTAVWEPPGRVHPSIVLHAPMLNVEFEDAGSPRVRIGGGALNKETGQVDRWSCVGAAEWNHGQGKVIFLPFDLTWSYYRYGHGWLARLLELALRDVAPEPPPADVRAPSIVQATFTSLGDRLVVHLLNDISSLGRSQNVRGESLYVRREVIPIHDIQITFRGPYRRFRLVPGGELTPLATPNGSQVSLPPLQIHLAVVAEP